MRQGIFYLKTPYWLYGSVTPFSVCSKRNIQKSSHKFSFWFNHKLRYRHLKLVYSIELSHKNMLFYKNTSVNVEEETCRNKLKWLQSELSASHVIALRHHVLVHLADNFIMCVLVV